MLFNTCYLVYTQKQQIIDTSWRILYSQVKFIFSVHINCILFYEFYLSLKIEKMTSCRFNADLYSVINTSYLKHCIIFLCNCF